MLNIYTVGEINSHIKRLLETDYVLQDVLVRGEISNYKKHSSGHHYFSLKDKDGVISAVMFKFDAFGLKVALKDGLNVIISGKISSFVKSGQYQLYAKEVTVDGVGDLHAEFEKLKQKLYDEGLFDTEHKKELPRFPKKIGVVTSQTGAVFSDIKRVISNRYKLAEIILYPVKVQGEGASIEIAEAINYFNNNDLVDVLIIGRGGGSMEDLWAFNDETLAYTIHASNIPVISAVGHEPDFVISDFVADVRASTPSNAGEIVVPSNESISTFLESVKLELDKNLSKKLADGKKDLQNLEKRIVKPENYIKERMLYVDFLLQKLKNPEILIKAQNESLNSLKIKLSHSFDTKISKKREKLGKTIAYLDGYSPLKVLSRGFGYSLDNNQKIVKSIKQLKVNDDITTRYKDGTVVSKIIEIKE